LLTIGWQYLKIGEKVSEKKRNRIYLDTSIAALHERVNEKHDSLHIIAQVLLEKIRQRILIINKSTEVAKVYDASASAFPQL
jgi:hypothetical protein